MLAHFDYLSFMAEFGRQISDVQEFTTRLENFTFMHNFINDHNASGASWVAGHNQFSDWSHVEYKAMLGYVHEERTVEATWLDASNTATPVDWRTEGAVNPIQDQAQCGSCWAFSAIQSFEAAHWNTTGTLMKFSEQQLVSCAGLRYGNLGCNGGMQARAYNYLMKTTVETEANYPYTSGQGVTGDCIYSAPKATDVKVASYTNVVANNVD